MYVIADHEYLYTRNRGQFIAKKTFYYCISPVDAEAVVFATNNNNTSGNTTHYIQQRVMYDTLQCSVS